MMLTKLCVGCPSAAAITGGKCLFADCMSVSMPLSVYGITCVFVHSNTIWLLKNTHKQGTPKGELCVRCLMFDDMVDDKYQFRGHNDTHFNEAVYATDHFLSTIETVKVGINL
jgi:hypothetical protein